MYVYVISTCIEVTFSFPSMLLLMVLNYWFEVVLQVKDPLIQLLQPTYVAGDSKQLNVWNVLCLTDNMMFGFQNVTIY